MILDACPTEGERSKWISEMKVAVCLGAVFLTLVMAFMVFTSYMEARSFRKLTGRADVTWFDALWVELRVDCER